MFNLKKTFKKYLILLFITISAITLWIALNRNGGNNMFENKLNAEIAEAKAKDNEKLQDYSRLNNR